MRANGFRVTALAAAVTVLLTSLVACSAGRVSTPELGAVGTRPAGLIDQTEQPEQAEQAEQADLLAAAQELVTAHPEVLSSAFVDRSRQQVTVRRAPSASPVEAAAVLRSAPSPALRALPVVTGAASARQIDSVLARAYDLRLPGAATVYSGGYDEQDDVVRLRVSKVDGPVRSAVQGAFGRWVTVEPGTAVGSDATEQKLEELFATKRWYARSPLPGGAAMAMKKAGYEARAGGCTSGFSWLSDSGKYWIITAGHCYDRTKSGGRNEYKFAFSRNVTAEPVKWRFLMGTAKATTVQEGKGTVKYHGAQRGDLARVSVDFRLTSGPSIYIGPGTGQAPVIGTMTRRPIKDDRFCISGARSGELCGFKVIKTNSSYKDSNGEGTFLKVVEASGPKCPDQGDSGAPVYIKNSRGEVNAKGILSGTGRTVFGKCRVFFTPIQNVTEIWGGRIVTR